MIIMEIFGLELHQVLPNLMVQIGLTTIQPTQIHQLI